jgi:hypothetical protein
MNKESFLRHIEKHRDCGTAALDNAVNMGLRRAKNDRLDSGKLIRLAAACVFTLAVCFIVSVYPLESLADEYYRNWHAVRPGGAETLDGYINGLAEFFKIYAGGR